MVESKSSSDQEIAWGWLAGAIVLAGAARLVVLPKPSFWLDEIFSSTFSTLSLRELLVANVRFDIHPPLYYLQLWIWALVGDADWWLLLNSTFWSLCSILLVGVVGSKAFDRNIGVISAFLLAVSPISIHYAQELRNYSLLMSLSIAAWYLQELYLEKGGSRRLLLAVGLQAAICLSHAAGPFMAMMIACAGFTQMLAERRWDRFRAWFFAELGVGVIAAGVIANAVVRTVTIVSVPDLTGIFQVLGHLIAGHGMAESPWLPAVGIVGMPLIWIGGWFAGRQRVGLLTLTLGSLVVALCVSYLLTPLWHWRPFIFLEPFFALSVGLLISRIVKADAPSASPRLILGGVSLVATLLAVLSITLLQPPPPHQNYREAAAVIRSMEQTGDGLVVAPRATYWGVARYLAGPNWGSPLEVQPLIPYDRWHEPISKLPDSVKRITGIVPKTDFIKAGDLTMIIGTLDDQHINRARMAPFSRLWVVTARSDERVQELDGTLLESLGLNVAERFDVRGLIIFLLERPQ